MFGRRRRGSSNPPLDRSAINPNAATAAASAFLSSKSSNASLASAAAGAALRSRPTTPTSVADVQTKRTLRRHNSNSSVGSSVAGVSRPGLERKNSSGSMSERTFRDQSPGRASIREASLDAPPVPAIPSNLKPAIPLKSHRRSTSLEPPTERFASPPPNRTNGRGSSMGPIGRSTPGRGQRITSLSSVEELTSVERPSSRGSVNFSYPINSPRAMSPAGSMRLTSPSPSRNRRPMSSQPPQITQNGQNLVYDPNTRSFRPASEIYLYDEPIQEEEEEEEEEETPVRRKKTVQPKGTASGSEIATGALFGGPKGTAVDAINAATSRAKEDKRTKPSNEQRIVTPEPVSRPTANAAKSVPTPPLNLPMTTLEPKKKKKRKTLVVSESGSEQGYTSNMSSASDNESDVSDRPRNSKGRIPLQKRPSIVRELPEDDESDSQMSATPQPQIPENAPSTSSHDPSAVTPTPVPRPNGAAKGKGRAKASASAAFAEERLNARSVSQPPASSTQLNGSTLESTVANVKGNRTVSSSPTRQTRFATDMEKPPNLTVMHHPPPRSLSPRKSALKNSNSPRGPSPADDMPGTWNKKGQNSSDMSDNSTALEDRPPRKKKNVRVSFDETNTVVGSAAPSVPSEASMLPSPQAKDKRKWFGINKRGNKTLNTGDEEEDDFMKPRPVLPSFGSVRERKIREPTEERPLVIPSESQHISEVPALPAPSIPASTRNNAATAVSSDHAVGSVVAQDAASKNGANKSRFLEPLPPVVTSVEGSGYSSDSSAQDSAKDKSPKETLFGPDSTPNGVTEPSTNTDIPSPDSDHQVFEDTESKDSPVDGPNSEVPKIALTRSTPTLEETEKQREWIVPGGFPSDNESEAVSPTISSETPASVGIAEPPAESVHIVSPTVAVEDSQTHPTSEHVDDTDQESVYDDAPEDLSDGDGFLSLNAVAASPITSLFKDRPPGMAVSSPPESPEDRSNKSQEPGMGEGWGKAQEYWAGLTVDKKREMEKEASKGAETSEDEDDDGDEEEEEQPPPPPPKPQKKKVLVAPIPVTVPKKSAPPHRTYQIPPGSKAMQNGQPALKSSLRSAPINERPESTSHMRKSMRNGGPNHGSVREYSGTSAPMQPKGALQKKARPMSYGAAAIQPDPVAVNKHLRQMSNPVNGNKTTIAPQLKRVNSTDSDSSFRRTRPRSHSMRGTMRNPVTQDRFERNPRSYSPAGDKTRSSNFSIRSLSPAGSAFRRPFSGGPPLSGAQGMRGTMRTNSNDSVKNPLIPGFRRSTSTTRPRSKVIAPRSSTRFADSSDEEDARPAFRSRFGDSSDEDDDGPPPLAGRTMRNSTLRSTPAKPSAPRSRPPPPPKRDDGESSDLPDSDDAAPQHEPRYPTIASTGLRRSGSGREYSPPKQQRGFLNILRRKKDPGSKVRKSDIESAARRDTPLERSKSELLGVRQSSGSVLQKRSLPTRTNSTGAVWPLRPASLMRGGSDQRPATANDADGLDEGDVEKRRPSLRGRRSTSGVLAVDIAGKGVNGSNSNVVLGRSGKPKRFMGLRRVLGIKD